MFALLPVAVAVARIVRESLCDSMVLVGMPAQTHTSEPPRDEPAVRQDRRELNAWDELVQGKGKRGLRPHCASKPAGRALRGA